MKKLLFSAAALAVLFAACKDDDTNPTPQANKYLLNVVSQYDSISVTYNTANRVDSFNSRPQIEGDIELKKAVYENGKLVEVHAGDETFTTLVKGYSYEYNAAGNPLKIKSYDEAGKIVRLDSIAYDNNGRFEALYVIEGEDGDNSPLKLREKYAFVWNGSNVVKQHFITIVDDKETTDTVTTTYTYDSKINPVAKQPELFLINPQVPAFALSANNILTETTEYSDYTETDTNEYTYDEENYPVTQKNTATSVQNGEVVYTHVTNTKYRYIKK